MSDREDRDAEFYGQVDEFIDLANERVPSWGTHRVSAVLLFAASRFNAHNYFATGGDPANRDAMIAYHREQYTKMLLDNLDWLADPDE